MVSAVPRRLEKAAEDLRLDDRGKQSVAVFVVNEGGTISQAQQYWPRHGFSIPVLMDPES